MKIEDRKIVLFFSLSDNSCARSSSYARESARIFHNSALNFGVPINSTVRKKTYVRFAKFRNPYGVWCGRNNRGSSEQRGNGISLRVNLRLTALTTAHVSLLPLDNIDKIAIVLLAMHSKYVHLEWFLVIVLPEVKPRNVPND